MKNQDLYDVLFLVNNIVNEFNRKKNLNILDRECHQALADAYRKIGDISLKGFFYHTEDEKNKILEAKASLIKCEQDFFSKIEKK